MKPHITVLTMTVVAALALLHSANAQRPVCHGFADIIIAIDDSESTQRPNPNDPSTNILAPGELELARYFISNSLLSSLDINLAIIAHSNSGRTLRGFTTNAADLSSSLLFEPEYLGSDTAAALSYAIDLHLNTGRPNAEKYIILLLDSASSTPVQTFVQARRATTNNIKVIPIAFGNNGTPASVLNSELILIGSSRQTKRVNSASELIGIAPDLINEVCPIVNFPTTPTITSTAIPNSVCQGEIDIVIAIDDSLTTQRNQGAVRVVAPGEIAFAEYIIRNSDLGANGVNIALIAHSNSARVLSEFSSSQNDLIAALSFTPEYWNSNTANALSKATELHLNSGRPMATKYTVLLVDFASSNLVTALRQANRAKDSRIAVIPIAFSNNGVTAPVSNSELAALGVSSTSYFRQNTDLGLLTITNDVIDYVCGGTVALVPLAAETTTQTTTTTTTTTAAPTIIAADITGKVCKGMADIVIAIDDSESTQRSDGQGGVVVAPGEFEFARYFIENYVLDSNNIKIGLIAHSRSGRVLSEFSSDQAHLLSKLTFPAEYQNSNTGAGMQAAIDMHLNSGRSGAAKYVLLLLDSGSSNPVQSLVQASRAKSNGVEIIPIAFGNNGNPAPILNTELVILGATTSSYKRVNSDTDLISLTPEITNGICPDLITVTTTTAAPTTTSTAAPTTTTPPPRNSFLNAITCQGLLDLAIAIDDSSSAQRTANGNIVLAPGQLELADYYIRNYLLDDSNVKIGIIAHSSSGRIISEFSTNSTALLESLDFTREYQGSNTASALSTAISLFSNSGRSGASRYLILFTDEPSSNFFQTLVQSSRTRNNGINVIPFAFGNDGSDASVTNGELALLGATSSSYIRVNSDAGVIEQISALNPRICPTLLTTQTTPAVTTITTTAAATTTPTTTEATTTTTVASTAAAASTSAAAPTISAAPTTTSTTAGPTTTAAPTAGVTTTTASSTSSTESTTVFSGTTAATSTTCQGLVDLVIVIDDSSGTERSNGAVAPGQLDMAKYYIRNSLLDASNVNIATIAYSGTARTLSGFSTDRTALINSLNFSPEYQWSNAAAALTQARGLFDSGRSNAAKYVIFFVDEPTSNPVETFIQGSLTRSSGVSVIPIAFGNDGTPSSVLNTELALIGASQNSFFRVDSDAEMLSIVPSVNQVVCPTLLTTASLFSPTTETASTSTPALTTGIATDIAVSSTTAAAAASTTSAATSTTCQGLVDIVIAIDDSSSAQRTSGGNTVLAPAQIELAEYYIRNSLLDSSHVNIAIIAHSNTGRILSGFSTDRTALLNSLTFTEEFGGSNTASGLSAATDLHLNSGRSNTARYVILFLDEPTSNFLQTTIQGSRARNNGINVIPIAFGNAGTPAPVTNIELGLIGSSSNSYIRVNNDAEILNFVPQINNVVCPYVLTTAAAISSTETSTPATAAISTAALTSTSTTAGSGGSGTATAASTSVDTTSTPVDTTSTAAATITVQSTTAAPTSETCQGLVDIVIAIDDSSSAQRTSGGNTVLAPAQIELAEYYIRNSLLDSSNVNIAIIAHSNTGRTLSGFSTDRTTLLNSLTFTEEFGGSNTASGLSAATDLHLNSGRSNAARYVILLVDEPTSNFLQTTIQGSRARNNGVNVIPIAFGNAGTPAPVTNIELGLIGSSSNSYIRVNNDAEILNFVIQINNVVCPYVLTTAAAISSTSTASSTTAVITTTATISTAAPTSTSTGAGTGGSGTGTTVVATSAPTTAATTESTAAATTESTVAATTTSTSADTPSTAAATVTAQSTTAAATSETCQGLVDIIIAIDDSSSAQRTSGGNTVLAPAQIELAEYYIRNSLLDSSNVNIAIIAHSNTGRILSGFSTNRTTLLNSLTFTEEFGGSNTASGLSAATDLHLNSGRSNAARYVILFVDEPTSNFLQTTIQGSRARNNGINVIPIAFGNAGTPAPVTNIELGLIGSSSNSYMRVNNDAEILNFVPQINNVVCPYVLTTAAAISSTSTAASTTAVITTTATISTVAPTSTSTGGGNGGSGTGTTVVATSAPTAAATTESTAAATTESTTAATTESTAAATTTSTSADTPSTAAATVTAQSTTAAPTSETCQGLVDIIIAIDDSSSAQRTSGGNTVLAPAQIELAEYYIRNSLLDSSNVNIAIIAHSNTGRILSGFSTNRTTLLNSLTFTEEFGGSNTASGLRAATDLHLNSGRSNAARYVIFFVDEPTSNFLQTTIQGSRARNNGVNVIPIAFGNAGTPAPVTNVELGLIGSSSNSYMRVNNDAEILNFVPQINNVVCPYVLTTTAAISSTSTAASTTAVITTTTTTTSTSADTTSTAAATVTAQSTTAAPTSETVLTTITTVATSPIVTTPEPSTSTTSRTSTQRASTGTATASAGPTATVTNAQQTTSASQAPAIMTSTAATTTTITVSTTTAATSETCQGQADIVVAIDDSSSARRTRNGNTVLAQGQLDLVQYYIRNSLLDSSNVNIGLVAHSDTGRIISSLSSNRTTLLQALNFPREYRGSKPANGLRVAIDLLLTGRSSAEKFLIFFTDEPSGNFLQTLVQAQRARTNGIHVIPVAFGDDGTPARVTNFELGALGRTITSYFRANTDAEVLALSSNVNAIVCLVQFTFRPVTTASTTTASASTSSQGTSSASTSSQGTSSASASSQGTSSASPSSQGTSSGISATTSPATLIPVVQTVAPSVFNCSTLGALNGITHVKDVSDAAKYFQCVQNGSSPTELEYQQASESKFCKFGTLWNDQVGACTIPTLFYTADDPCRNGATGDRAYGIQCNSYWSCVGLDNAFSEAQCCASEYAFVEGSGCVADSSCNASCPTNVVTPHIKFCPYTVSPLGPHYYRVFDNYFITDKACPQGLSFDIDDCTCVGNTTDHCSEDLFLDFNNFTMQDSSNNYNSLTFFPLRSLFSQTDNDTVVLWGANYIIVPATANKEFQTITIVIKFKANGATNNQVLIHNSPLNDPSGPSVRIDVTETGVGQQVNVSFLLVLANEDPISVTPIVLAGDKSDFLEARLSYNGTDITAELVQNGTVDFESRIAVGGPLALRKGAFNIGGGGCRLCRNFVGLLDFVKVFDCPALRSDLFEEPAAGLRDVITYMNNDPVIPTPPPVFKSGHAPLSPVEAKAQCKVGEFFNGIAHVPYSADCTKFIQCSLDNNFDFMANVTDCNFGSMWSAEKEACSLPSQSECDPCKREATNVRFAYNQSCRAYLQCVYGVSTPRCCAEGERYDENVGCVSDPTCNGPCEMDPDPFYTCTLTQSSVGAGYYFDIITLVDRACPPGLGFNQSDCGCTNVIGDLTRVCQPYMDLEFTEFLIADKSPNNFTIDHNLVSVTGNTADFRHNQANIAVLGTANVEYYNSQFGLIINFTAFENMTGVETIIYNGWAGTENSSFRIEIDNMDNNTITVSALLVTENDVNETTQVLMASKSGSIALALVYDGAMVSFKVISDSGSFTDSRPATGNVVRKQGAVNIGSGWCFGMPCNTFSGTITDVQLFLCAPPQIRS